MRRGARDNTIDHVTGSYSDTDINVSAQKLQGLVEIISKKKEDIRHDDTVAHASRGLHMSLLGLTASASIVAGVFVAAAPAYSDDGVPDVSPSCLVATEEDATVHVSSLVHAGESVHAEGQWDGGRARARRVAS